MRRYFKEVKALDKGEIDIPEFIRKTGGSPERWADWQACWWIYIEDGGKKYTAEEWFKGAPPAPIPYSEVKYDLP